MNKSQKQINKEHFENNKLILSKIKTGQTTLNDRRAENLIVLLKEVIGLEGQIAEVGTYKGGSALLIAKELSEEKFYVFDTFEGMAHYSEEHDAYHLKGAFSDASYEEVSKLLSPYPNVSVFKGVFPEDTSGEINDEDVFKFVHIDVDNYQPYLDCMEYFYPRMQKGGIMVFDDYGFESCPGAKMAVDEFFDSRDEEGIIRGDFGGAYIIKS